MLDLSVALATAVDAAADARRILLAECARAEGPRGEIGQCPADLEAELAIRTRLLDAFPSWGYLGEESGNNPPVSDADPIWVVDPNDGTTSMQRGYRGHAISIGLVHEELPVLGVVCAVDAPDDNGDLFTWAEGCGPLQRNGVVLDRGEWPGVLGPFDIVALSQGANRNPVGYGRCVSPARFVGLPSIAYRLALTAAGECAATLSLNLLNMWDYAAGHALVRGAGGVLVGEDGYAQVRYRWSDRNATRRVFCGSPNVVGHLLKQPWDRAPGSGFGDASPPPDLAPVRARPNGLVHDTQLLDRAQGCLLGQLAGDALGALVEFSSAAEIARKHRHGPHRLASGGPHQILAGQPTDDSELALVLARRLVADFEYDPERIAKAYAAWYHGWTHSEAPAACGHPHCAPFDIGGTIGRALGAISARDAMEATCAPCAMQSANPASQANGALMRISPLGIWGALREPTQVADTARQDAQLTHPHPVCQDSNALFAVTIAAAIRQRLDAQQTYACALHFARTQHLHASVVAALESAATTPPDGYVSQQGWVLIALHNAFYRLTHAQSLEEAVVATVRSGGDTDTNAAVCGALLGAVHGRTGIPHQWQQMVLTCRPMPGYPGVHQPRPAIYWPTDALVLAERLVLPGA